jgi:sugar/nucleoside kinase (ribokinase family)
VDGLVLNDGEARMLTGEHNLMAAGRKILQAGPSFVVIKKGEHGSLLIGRGGTPGRTGLRVCPMPAYPSLDVKDPTGAGDSFAGGMMGFLAGAGKYDFRHLTRAMAYGTVIASHEIEDFSLRRFETLTTDDIDARIREFAVMAGFGEPG